MPTATPEPQCVSTGGVDQDGAVSPGDAQLAFLIDLDCAGQNPAALAAGPALIKSGSYGRNMEN